MVTAVLAEALLDPATGETTRGGVTVLVEDGRISARGPRGQVSAPRDARVVDAEGMTLLPGLVDAHVHLCVEGRGMNLGDMLQTPPSLHVLRAVESLPSHPGGRHHDHPGRGRDSQRGPAGG